jgi:hypothetical protein
METACPIEGQCSVTLPVSVRQLELEARPDRTARRGVAGAATLVDVDLHIISQRFTQRWIPAGKLTVMPGSFCGA